MRSSIVVKDCHLVMGTTGGDWNKLVKDVEASGVYTVIAPQMSKQVGVCDDDSAGLRHNSMCKWRGGESGGRGVLHQVFLLTTTEPWYSILAQLVFLLPCKKAPSGGFCWLVFWNWFARDNLLQSGDLQQVVAFQAAMELMAEQFPGALAGYTLQVFYHPSSLIRLWPRSLSC